MCLTSWLRAEELKPGHIVDLEGDEFADPDRSPDLLQPRAVDLVDEMEHCRVCVRVRGVGAFRFPADHLIRVIGEHTDG